MGERERGAVRVAETFDRARPRSPENPIGIGVRDAVPGNHDGILSVDDCSRDIGRCCDFSRNDRNLITEIGIFEDLPGIEGANRNVIGLIPHRSGEAIRGVGHLDFLGVRRTGCPVANSVTVGVIHLAPRNGNRGNTGRFRRQVFGNRQNSRYFRDDVAPVGRGVTRTFGTRLNRKVIGRFRIGNRYRITDIANGNLGPVFLIGAVTQNVVVGVGNRVPTENQVGRRLRLHIEIFRRSERTNDGAVALVGAQIDGRTFDAGIPGKIDVPHLIRQTPEIDRLRVVVEHQVGAVGIDQFPLRAETGIFDKKGERLVIVDERLGGRPFGAGRHGVIAVARRGRSVRQVPPVGIKRDDAVVDVERTAVIDSAAEEPFGGGREIGIIRGVPRHGATVEIRGSGIIERAAAVGRQRGIGTDGVVEEFAVVDGNGSGIVDTAAKRAARVGAVPGNPCGRNRHGSAVIETAAAGIVARRGVPGNGRVGEG